MDLVVYVVSAAAFLVKGEGRVVVAESASLAVETRVALDLVGHDASECNPPNATHIGCLNRAGWWLFLHDPLA